MDTEGLLRSLNASRVRYVVIGATAFPVHGYARATLDVDLFIEATDANAAAVREALSNFGFDVSDLTIEDLQEKKVLIREYVIQVDIHPFVAGGIAFEEVWANRIEDQIGETPASFAGLDDLIRMKEAAGRPKDEEDLRALRAIRLRRDEPR